MPSEFIDLREGRSQALKDITLLFGCRNLVFASPHTASGETVAYTTRVVAEGVSSVGICWLAQLTLNLGQDPLS